MTKPMIGVLTSRFIPGINHIAEIENVPNDERATPLPYDEVFGTEFGHDAHFICYRPPDDGIYPRCNLPSLSSIRDSGFDLTASVLAFDYDNPGHRPWESDEQLAMFFSVVERVGVEFPIARNWSTIYTTKHGARIVYTLDRPVPVDKSEGMHRWMVRHIRQAGLDIDKKCSDWTRLFRLPRVLRDGKPSWEDPFFVQFDQDSTLGVDGLGSDALTAEQVYAEIEAYSASRPDHGVTDHIWTDVSLGKLTPLGKVFQRRLKGRECYDCIFRGLPLAGSGERNVKIHEYAGQVIGVLHGLAEVTPEICYGLLLPAVEKLVPDRDTPDWLGVLWDAVCRLWSKQDAKAKAKQAEKIETVDITAQGMKQWCPELQKCADDEEARKFVAAHAIVGHASEFYLLNRRGEYGTRPYSLTLLLSAIEKTGLKDVINLYTLSEKGSLVLRRKDDILAAHCTPVTEVRFKAGLPQPIVTNMNTDRAAFELSPYKRRTDLDPTYDLHVDEWLKRFGGDNYEILRKWLAWSLAIEEGAICALSIVGDQGVGKKMLVAGLAEAMDPPGALASDDDLCTQYQTGLFESPFLVVNEGWRGVTLGAAHPFDTFRKLVSGDPIKINEKYRKAVSLQTAVRVIFTANNDMLLENLVGQRPMSMQDREALAVRLLHIEAERDASLWLRSKGGMRFTGADGRRWIRGDTGAPSDHVVAKHFLWLHQHRHDFGPAAERFLVEGNYDDALMFRLRTKAGGADLVVEALCRMTQMCPHQAPNSGWFVDEYGTLYVVPFAILDFFRTNLGHKTKERLTLQHVQMTLKGIRHPRALDIEGQIKGREQVGNVVWTPVDSEVVLRSAKVNGYPATTLLSLTSRKDQHDSSRRP